MAQSPVDIARATLLQLADLGLPPTPENYAKYYYQVSGEPLPEPCAEIARAMAADVALADLIKTLVETITHKTGSLASGLGSSNDGLKRSIEDLERTRDKGKILELLSAIVSSAGEIQHSVESTHNELLEAKHSLDDIKHELEESRRLLNEDALTGAQNRRGMDIVLAREIDRAKAHGSKLTVAMADLDHFKQVNDTFGHGAGDEALVHFATVARSVLREADVLARYGGEEFLLILPETAQTGAEFVVGRLQQMMKNSPLLHEGKKIDLAFSAGIAQLKSDENAHALVMRADNALLAAKQAGRNCIKTAD